MSHREAVGIVGAGPAGATLARLLAEAGVAALLIDEREPHEKVCGGAVTARGYRGRAVLEAALEPCVEARRAVLESGGERAEVPLPEPVRIYPRLTLNRVLFEAALSAGARFVQARVLGLSSRGGGFRIDLAGSQPLEVGFLAGADGAAGITRKLLGGGRGRGRFVLPVGFHAVRPPGETELYLSFPPGLPGYVWSFPRPDHLSVGICCRDPSLTPAALRELLRAELEQSGREAPALPGSEFSFPIPDFPAFEGKRAGPGWALIGDAGGFVDPITLEGISYAMRSAELLAAAILHGRPESFEQAWRADFGREIALAARWVRGFYREGFTTRMVRAVADYPRVQRIAARLLCGSLPYRGLRGRLVRALAADRASALVARIAAPFGPKRL